ncbi:MAG: hypothetical protein ACOXZV_04810 [Bacteroidales bacterium]|jgi:hypothetical protein
MKKHSFIYMLIASVLLIAFGACERDEGPVDDRMDTYQEPDKVHEQLYVLGKSVNMLMQEAEFKSYVYDEIEKKFDGDYNVLFKNVENKFPSAEILKSEESKSSKGYFDNLKRYPQIYIPFFEELKRNGKLGKKSPVILIYTDEIESGEYPGYTLEKNGSLKRLNFLIDEKYAENNEVWVLSLNERVDENGELLTDFITFPSASALTLTLASATPDDEIYSLSSKGTMACTPPLKPGKVEVYPSSPNSVYLEWEDVSNAAYYKIYRDKDYSGNYSYVKTVNRAADGSAWTNSGLNAGSHYSYQVQAFNAEDCFSARTFGVGTWASWRTNNYNDLLYQIYISDGCWNWCCGWPEGDIELKYRLVKYNKSDQQIEYPKNALPQKSKKAQKGKWCTYNKDLFRWDIGKYAYNYLLFFYEDDGGNDKGTTIRLSASFKPVDNLSLGADIAFTIDDRDEELGWVEIYHFDENGKQYPLSPRKGSALIKVRQ